MKIAVVGLGHIGLPLAVQYASRDHEVVGVDVADWIVDAINRGESPHRDEQALVERVPQLVAAGCVPRPGATPRPCARRT
jgi:UDP-N-acetyl-D-mannosaminuronate dehydrogenase